MSQPAATDDCPALRAIATATPGLLARIAAVLNPYPVSDFDYTESGDGTVTITIRIGPGSSARTEWHAGRVSARLDRVIEITSIERLR